VVDAAIVIVITAIVLKQSKTLTFFFCYVCFSLKICFFNGKGRGG